jgi:hypothetical protein
MKGDLGRVFLRYAGIPIVQSSACDENSCRRRTTPSVRLYCYSPQWLLTYAISLQIGWGTLTANGASLHLRIPIVTYDTDSVRTVIDNDVNWMPRNVATKRFLLTNVDKDGL